MTNAQVLWGFGSGIACGSGFLLVAALATSFAGESAPRHAGPPVSAESWVRREKIRCLSYLDASTQGVRYVPQVRAMGFNCALAMLANGPVERVMPLIEATDRVGIHLFLVDYCDTKKFLAERNAGSKRPFVAADGRESSHLPCPADPDYWQAVLGKRAVELARLRRTGHASLAGWLVDIEDYAGLGDLACGGIWPCYCDRCFGAFAASVGKSGETIAAAHRAGWLQTNSLSARYFSFQDDAVVRVLAEIRRQVDAIAPEFLLAVYPWPSVEPAQRGARVAWDVRFARGLGTPAAPFLFFDENTYVWGYDPSVERREADLAVLGLNFVAIAGFNPIPSERIWWPEQMAASAGWATHRSGGYWLYVGDWALLQAPAGRELSGVWGDRPGAWVQEFTKLNQLLASKKSPKLPLLPLPPLKDCLQLSELYNPKHAAGAAMFVRRWSEIGLPWDGGELVMLGNKACDWLSFQRSVSRSDRYQISAWLTAGPSRPIVQLEVDDQPVGEAVDLYQRITSPGEQVVLGFAHLEAGNHTFRLKVSGKNSGATGNEIGLRAVRIERVGYPPRTWSVIGPFDNTGENFPAFDIAYPPEREINLDASYPGKGGQPVRWREVNANPDGYLDLLPLFSDRKDAVAYCLTHVHCPSDGPRTVLLGSDDGGKLFVNGNVVWAEAKNRSAVRDENAPRAGFHHGWNTVLVKILQTSGSWGVYLRVYDPKREIKYSPVPISE